MEAGSQDRRVRDMFEWSITDPGDKTGFVNRVFNNELFKRHIVRRGSKPSRFRNQSPTRFQQLLSMSTVKRVELERKVPAKRQKVSSSKKKSVLFLEGYTMSNRQHSHPMAYGIQRICMAWDAFATSVGFTDCEQMLLPYIIVDRATLSFSVVSSRSNGYSPKTFGHTLGPELKAVTDQNRVSQCACRFSDEVDGIMGELAKEFLNELGKIVLNSFLYQMQESSRWFVLTLSRGGIELIHDRDSKTFHVVCGVFKSVVQCILR